METKEGKKKEKEKKKPISKKGRRKKETHLLWRKHARKSKDKNAPPSSYHETHMETLIKHR